MMWKPTIHTGLISTVLALLVGWPGEIRAQEIVEVGDRSANCDEDPACFNLGALKYKEGRQSAAIKYFEKACKMGNIPGCNNEKRLKR